MEEQTTAQEPVSINDRIANYLSSASEPAEPQEEIEQEAQPETEASDEVETEVSASEEVEEAEEEVEITHNGETKRLKKSEAIELAQKGFDYTKKTQELAEQRKRFEADQQALQQSYAMQNVLSEQFAEVKSLDRQLEAYKGFNWHELAEQDPVKYLQVNQTYRDLKEAREAKVQEMQGLGQRFQQQQKQHMSEILAREQAELAKAVPEFASTEKRAEAVTKLRSYLADYGYSEAEIASATDHRTVSIAWKAMQWDAQQKAKPAITKKVSNLPKPVKPGVSQSKGEQQADNHKQLRQQLKKTGKVPPGLLAKYL